MLRWLVMTSARGRGPTTNATFCATLVDEWVRAGLTDAVIAPGSRSTPIALALADRSEVTLHVHIDERSAGFIAVGLGLATGRPAVVLTTSGTAAVELHPAVVEAHQAAVPLLAVTADRPAELHGVGAPQTVDQTRLFGTAVRWFAEPGPPTDDGRSWWRSVGARAMAEAFGAGGRGPGPVHLNLAFREPLVGRPGELPDGRPGGAPWSRRHSAPERPAAELLSSSVLGGRPGPSRVVVVAGAGSGDPETVLAAAALSGWPVIADPRSGLRTGHQSVVTTADTVLRDAKLADDLRPDVVLRVGEPPASKVLANWLQSSGAVQVAGERYGRVFDPEMTANDIVGGDPAAMLTVLAERGELRCAPEWTRRWREAEERADAVLTELLADPSAEVSDPSVSRAVADLARERTGTAVVVSSSMPIRDLEWYGGHVGTGPVLANRGANGIDGVVSTAVGVALGRRETSGGTVALVGDLAFLHDTNALIGLAAREVDLVIVVVDNDGGAIFSFLPPAVELAPERFETLFATPHGSDLASLARAHRVEVSEVAPGSAVSDLRLAIGAALDAGGPRVVVVRTDRAVNVKAHERLNDEVRRRLA